MTIMKVKIPSSVSELQYINHPLFVAIMGSVVALLLFKGLYLPALCFAGVYVFRYFHRMIQKEFHYAFAIGGFVSLAYELHMFFPVIIGAIYAVWARSKERPNYIFWFEMIAGIPYLIKVLGL